MRPLTLSLCIVTGVLALRPASHFFREEARRPDVMNTASEAPEATAVKLAQASAPPVEVYTHPIAAVRAAPTHVEPASVLMIRVAPRAPQGTPVDGDGELIAAIKTELTRLGYYDGPTNARWDADVRKAARAFSGVKRSAPTQALLTALKAAKPDGRRSARRDYPVPVIAVRSEPPVELARPVFVSEGYLPPSDLRDKTPWTAAAPIAQAGADAVQGAPKPRRVHTRKRERAARGRRHFASNYSWRF
jgi:hypothetical protein